MYFLASCEAGRYFNLESGECEDCGYGFFQPNVGSFSCNPCGVGKTTLSTKSATEEECRDECADGEHLMQAGTCEKCDQGTYRTKGVHKTCNSCPVGITTEGKGAVRREDCNTPRCESGQFLVVTSKQCQLCPRATYQDEPLQTSCKLCPEDHTTAGLGSLLSTVRCERSVYLRPTNCRSDARVTVLFDQSVRDRRG